MFATSYIFTTFSSNSFKQLNKISQQFELLRPSEKMFRASTFQLSEHSSVNLLRSSTPSLLELLLRSLFYLFFFFFELLKTLTILILLFIPVIYICVYIYIYMYIYIYIIYIYIVNPGIKIYSLTTNETQIEIRNFNGVFCK